MNVPNKLTLTRLFLVPVFVVLVFLEVGVFGMFNDYLAFLVFAIASFTDFLDGYLARKWHMITDFGKLFDSAADKLLCGSALILLVYIFAVVSPVFANATMNLAFLICITLFAVIMICREMFITAFKSVAASKNIIIAADMPGKIKAVLQMVGLMIILLVPDTLLFGEVAGLIGQIIFYIGFACLAVATVMAIVSCVLYCCKYREVFADA